MQLDWQSIGVQTVREADNGTDALKIALDVQPDVILADIRMPGLDGLELARQIHESGVDCKMLILSGYGTFEYAKQAIKYGVYDYLLKPAAPQDVLDAVKRALAEKKKMRTEVLRSQMHQTVIDMGSEQGQGQEIVRYIEENYMNDISLTTLSEALHFTPTYLSRLIKKLTGYNFMYIVGIMRMLKAAELLTTTNLKVFMISEKVGINDPRYFSILFKKTFGKTPGEYRKEQHTGSEVTLLNFLGMEKQQ